LADKRKAVINLSDVPLEDAAYSALGKGLNYAVAPAVLPISDFLSGVEKAVGAMLEEAAEAVRQESFRILKASRKPKDNLSRAERRALRTLRTNADLTVLPADKDNASVVLNTSDYNRKIASLLGAPTYRRLPKDPTEFVERKTTLLLKKSSLSEGVIQQLRSQGSRPPRLDGLPKIHKKGAPLRPIVSTIGAPTYRLSKCLAKHLGEYVGNSPRHVKNSMEFMNTIKSLRAGPEDILVSFDVASLLTMAPIVEALRLLSRQFDEILRLFLHVLISAFFRFNGQFYEQADGVAMGSPSSPVIADFFMEHFDETALEGATHKPLCWFRYVDDTFVILPHGPGKLSEFLDHLNIHESIQFTMETERDGHLPFLDIDIHRKPDGTLGHKVYRKPTHTNLCLNSTLITILPRNRLYCPHWCTGPDPFVTRRACMGNWSFSGPLSGRTATATDRSDGLSTHRRESHRPRRSLLRSPSCPT
jgi:hypothetical protein